MQKFPSMHRVHLSQLMKIRFLSNNIGAPWLSGRELDSRPRGRGFEPYRRHCVVVLEHSLVLVQPRKTRPCLTERLFMRRKESNQTKIKTKQTCMHSYLVGLEGNILFEIS